MTASRFSARRITPFLAALLLLWPGAPAMADEHTLAERLDAVTPEQGEKVFKRCRACHVIERDAEPGIAPNLWGVLGRPVASQEGYPYSEALRSMGGVWTPERLDAFLVDPHEEVEGTRMPFRGISDPVERAALIAYLNTMTDSPVELPTTHTMVEIEPEEPEYGVLVEAPGVDITYAYCSACHSERLVAQQGLDREGWLELIEWMQEEQGMGEIDEEDLAVILDYLSTNYGPDRPNFPAN